MAKITSHIKCVSFQLLVASALMFSFIQNSLGEDVQIKGTVYDGASYEALAGAKVELLSNKASATSDASGQFTISASTSIRNMNSQFLSAFKTQIKGTILSFTIPGEKPMSLSIHAVDLSGRNVWLFKGTAAAGKHTLNLADKLRSAGVYVLNISLNSIGNIQTRIIALNGVFSAVDIMELNGTTVKAVVRAMASAQDTLAISKTGYQTRKMALKTPATEALKIRLSPTEGKYHHPAVLLEEYTYETANFPQIHASSIEDLPNGDLVCVYFGGPGEKKLGTVIRFQRKPLGGKWSAPIVLGDDGGGGKKYPCWNPVIYQVPEGELLFWWKVGPTPKSWWGMLKRSTDNGKTWSAEVKLGGPRNPDILGPVKNKPKMLKNGTILAGSSRENEGWVTHVEHSTDKGKTWKWITKVGMGQVSHAIQPCIMEFDDGHIKMMMRTRKGGRVGVTTSKDYGVTWTPIKNSSLPHNGAGLDAVTLMDGRQLLVYNHTTGGRSWLNVSVSDDGELWKAVVVLESPKKDNGEKSYPAIIQSSDGLVHITYTYKRRKPKHVVINPDLIKDPVPMPGGQWPSSGPASVVPTR